MNLYECINKFIDMERNAIDVYEKIENTSIEEIKENARILKEEEKKHIIFLEDFRIKMGDIEIDLEIENFIHTIEEEEREEFNKKDFFLLALKLEKNSATIYEIFKNKFPEGSYGNKLFTLLVNEEKSHMLYILKQSHL